MSICDDGTELHVGLEVVSIQTQTWRRTDNPANIADTIPESAKVLNPIPNNFEDNPYLQQDSNKMEAVSQTISSESVEKTMSSSGGPVITENPDGSITTTSSTSMSEVSKTK